MKNAFLALAFAVPAIVVAAETPEAGFKEAVQQQAKSEFSILSLQNPAPANKESNFEQIAYLFSLVNGARLAALDTAKSITDKETAEAKAIELTARLDVYVGVSIAVAFAGMNAQLTEEEVAKVQEIGIAGEETDKLLAQEVRRLKDAGLFGSPLLKQAMDYLDEQYGNKGGQAAPAPEVKIETE